MNSQSANATMAATSIPQPENETFYIKQTIAPLPRRNEVDDATANVRAATSLLFKSISTAHSPRPGSASIPRPLFRSRLAAHLKAMQPRHTVDLLGFLTWCRTRCCCPGELLSSEEEHGKPWLPFTTVRAAFAAGLDHQERLFAQQKYDGIAINPMKELACEARRLFEPSLCVAIQRFLKSQTSACICLSRDELKPATMDLAIARLCRTSHRPSSSGGNSAKTFDLLLRELSVPSPESDGTMQLHDFVEVISQFEPDLLRVFDSCATGHRPRRGLTMAEFCSVIKDLLGREHESDSKSVDRAMQSAFLNNVRGRFKMNFLNFCEAICVIGVCELAPARAERDQPTAARLLSTLLRMGLVPTSQASQHETVNSGANSIGGDDGKSSPLSNELSRQESEEVGLTPTLTLAAFTTLPSVSSARREYEARQELELRQQMLLEQKSARERNNGASDAQSDEQPRRGQSNNASNDVAHDDDDDDDDSQMWQTWPYYPIRDRQVARRVMRIPVPDPSDSAEVRAFVQAASIHQSVSNYREATESIMHALHLVRNSMIDYLVKGPGSATEDAEAAARPKAPERRKSKKEVQAERDASRANPRKKVASPPTNAGTTTKRQESKSSLASQRKRSSKIKAVVAQPDESRGTEERVPEELVRNQVLILLRAACIYESAGEMRHALDALFAAKRLASENLPTRDTLVARANDRLGCGLFDSGHAKAALHCFRAAAKVRRQLLGDTHPDVLGVVMNMAVAYEACLPAQPELPARVYSFVSAHFGAQLGPNHPRTIMARENLRAVRVRRLVHRCSSIDELKIMQQSARFLRKSRAAGQPSSRYSAPPSE